MENIYNIIVKENKICEKFKILMHDRLFEPAKKIIENILYLMSDKDGNFVQQFQSDGFDARLWEIYIFIFLKENNFDFIDDIDRPDFHIQKNGEDIFIEASSSSQKPDDVFSNEFIRNSINNMDLEVQQQLTDYYLMRMGSVLFSKLNKRYWERDWVKNKSIILAVSAAHNDFASFLPDSQITEYLYGRRVLEKENGLFETELINEHRFKEKIIPSNFFNQPFTENISAVIFTNNCDIHKFNRMGYQSNLTKKPLSIIRTGKKYDEDSNDKISSFTYFVQKNEHKEIWGESVTIFHNPNAKIKINKNMFEAIRQVWIEPDNSFNGIMTDNFVFHSQTSVIEV